MMLYQPPPFIGSWGSNQIGLGKKKKKQPKREREKVYY